MKNHEFILKGGFIEVEFFRSAENDSHLFNKNFTLKLYDTQRNFWKTVDFTVPVDHYRIDRKGVGDILYNQPFSFTCLGILQ
jgi:hypothetical protein